VAVLLHTLVENKEKIMAIAPNFTTGLLGYDPLEQQRQQQKMWAGMYGQASSPYEKIGLGLGQLGGALIGGLMGDSPAQKKEKAVMEVRQAADAQFTPGSAEYFRFVAENLPAEYADSRAFAAQEAAKAQAAADKMYLDRVKTVTENPAQMGIVSAPLSNQVQSQIAKMSEATGQPLNEQQIASLQASPQFQQLAGLTAAQEAGVAKQAPATPEFVNKELLAQAIQDSGGDVRQGAILYNQRRLAEKERVAKAGVPPVAGTVKTSDINTFVSNVATQTKPAREKLERYNELKTIISEVQRGNTQAVPQLERWLVTAAGDKQIGMNEVRQIASAGGFVERSVGGVQKFLVGLPTKDKLTKITSIVDSLEDRTGQSLNKNLDSLTKVWGTSELPPETIQSTLGERYITAAERKRRTADAAKNPPAAGGMSVTPSQQNLLNKYNQPTR
jgi:hypothetical protein